MKVPRSVLGLSLAATLLAAVLAPEAADDADATIRRSNSGATERAADSPGANLAPMPSSVAPVEVLAIRPRSADDDLPSAFGTLNRPSPVMPAAAVVPLVPEAAVAQAPALPFRILGRHIDAGVETVFLQHAEQNIAARVGDVVSEHYKVESVSAGVLTLIYLPLNQRQTLDIGETP